MKHNETWIYLSFLLWQNRSEWSASGGGGFGGSHRDGSDLHRSQERWAAPCTVFQCHHQVSSSCLSTYTSTKSSVFVQLIGKHLCPWLWNISLPPPPQRDVLSWPMQLVNQTFDLLSLALPTALTFWTRSYCWIMMFVARLNTHCSVLTYAND